MVKIPFERYLELIDAIQNLFFVYKLKRHVFSSVLEATNLVPELETFFVGFTRQEVKLLMQSKIVSVKRLKKIPGEQL